MEWGRGERSVNVAVEVRRWNWREGGGVSGGMVGEGGSGGGGEGIERVGIASAAWDGVGNAGARVVEWMRANVPLRRL